jgi:hypothetical protein
MAIIYYYNVSVFAQGDPNEQSDHWEIKQEKNGSVNINGTIIPWEFVVGTPPWEFRVPNTMEAWGVVNYPYTIGVASGGNVKVILKWVTSKNTPAPKRVYILEDASVGWVVASQAAENVGTTNNPPVNGLGDPSQYSQEPSHHENFLMGGYDWVNGLASDGKKLRRIDNPNSDVELSFT